MKRPRPTRGCQDTGKKEAPEILKLLVFTKMYTVGYFGLKSTTDFITT
jgi:hypothetical protein